LDQFEEKIRVIANLEPLQGDDNLFGVGGAAPEDLDPQLEITQRHEGLIREMHQQVDELDRASQRHEKTFGILLDKLEGQRNLLASTPAIRPTSGWITSRFGHRVSPFTGRKEFHKGVDISNRKGTAILATANGVVTYAGIKGTMGNVLVIDHGHGMITRYAHLSEGLKKQGEKVKRGDIIAQMGSSGRSTGPHLHYEVHLNGVPVNPEHYILN
jgi:murein DD-endopeptidase MepM/ murein hydrolase activator NlpD